MPKIVEYKFKINAFSPETIPMARLADYLSELATLLGEKDSVHFLRVEGGSTVPVIGVEWEAVPKIDHRIGEARVDEGPVEAIRAKHSLERFLVADNAAGELVNPSGTRILHFPARRRFNQLEYGPIKQETTLDGYIIMVGGERDPVPVHLQDGDTTFNCRASRIVAKRLAPMMFDTKLRVAGAGTYFRNEHGRWEMRRFTIETFTVLKTEALSKTVERLRRIGAAWKTTNDPLSTLDEIRHGDSRTH
jgi:hypothetical protein